MRSLFAPVVLVAGLWAGSAQASVLTYGDEDCLNQGCYGAADPTSGATLEGLAANAITLATNSFGHLYPFSPSADFAGTDQIYVGSVQTGAHDGYAGATERTNGPQTLTLDFSPLISGGQSLASLTLGIAADDFQFPSLGQPFTASVDGSVNAALTAQLNAFDEGGPRVQFFTIGLDPLIDTGSHILTVSIDEGGDGGDGWAVDFLTVGVTTQATSAVPEPSALAVLGAAIAIMVVAALRRRILTSEF
jgi:hypothetical protein